MKPLYPSKEIRLTLDPVQAVYLWSLLDKSIEFFDHVKNQDDQDKFGLLVLESIEDKLSDRLTFTDFEKNEA